MREWWSGEVEAPMKMKKAEWKDALGARERIVKGRYSSIYKYGTKFKANIYQIKK